MGETQTKEIAIIMFQYSVVVKGIERKLGDMGYQVTTIADNLEDRVRVNGHTHLFVFYLPSDIMDDTVKKRTLHLVSDMILDRGQRMILLGDEKYHHELCEEVPVIKDCSWLNRPIDMKLLENTVEKEIDRSGDPDAQRRILIVDDDPSFAKMVREWIKEYYRVDIVTAGMQAISFLLKIPENEKVDLILLDYEMPVVDGPQVLQMLRQEPETAGIPVIFLTGIGTKEAVSRVMELKPDGYILKSTSREQLLMFLKKKLS
ncbi:MAG: response regulator [Lachnospiraceae bacterium]|nr:response regulator [Lachnospiraceae bacterium]